MRRFFRFLGTVLGLLVLAFVSFYFFAKSPTRPISAYLTFHTYTDPFPTPARSDTFSVMTYNIGYLSGMTNNLPVEIDPSLYAANLGHAMNLLRQYTPDIVAFQEIDFDAHRSQYINQLDTLAQLLDYHAAAGAINWDKRYVPFPYGLPSVNYRQIVSGQGVLSRYQIARNERVTLEKPPAPFYYNALYLDRLVQVTEVKLAESIIVMNVHLEAFDAGTRQRQAEVVRAMFDAYAEDYPVVLLGDFNAPMAAQQALAADPGVAEESAYAGDNTTGILLGAEAIAEVFPDSLYAQMNLGTYPADDPRFKIDHIFYSTAHFDLVDAEVVRVANEPSDHSAVVARLVFKPEPNADAVD